MERLEESKQEETAASDVQGNQEIEDELDGLQLETHKDPRVAALVNELTRSKDGSMDDNAKSEKS